jgi:hypothetical protein
MNETDHGTTVVTLQARVDRLERETRMWRIAAVAAIAVFGLLGAGKASGPIPDEVRAKRFVLVDETGREHARLGFGVVGAFKPHLEPELCLGDREKSGTCVYPYGLSTRASNNGFVNLNPIGLRITLGSTEFNVNMGMGGAGPLVSLDGPTPEIVLTDSQKRVLWKSP